MMSPETSIMSKRACIRASGSGNLCKAPSLHRRADGDIVYGCNLATNYPLPLESGEEGKVFTLLRVRFQSDPLGGAWTDLKARLEGAIAGARVAFNRAVYRVEDVDSDKSLHLFEVYYAFPCDGQEIGYGEIEV